MPAAQSIRRDIASQARDTASPADFAGTNRSLPIRTPADVTAAIKAIRRGGADDATKLKVIRLAKRKGAAFVAKLPADWQLAGRAAKGTTLAPFIGRIELADKDGDEPRASWAQILRTGEFYDPRYGDFSITSADLAQMVANFKDGKYPQRPTELTGDYNHGTSRPESIDEGKSSGWVKDLEVRGEGDELWAMVEWTETAAALIDAKEYQFISATFSFDYTNSNGGEEIGPTLLAFALTNRPVVHGMQPVALAMVDPGAVRLAGANVIPEIAASLFSFDETRRRLQAALTAMFGVYGYSDYDGGCRGVYLVDLFDDHVIYGEYGGARFSVDYSIAADGTVGFTSSPTEVVIDYRPLTAAAADIEETTMSSIKTKDAKGNDIELSTEQVAAIVKAHGAPAPAAGQVVDLAAFKALEAKVTSQESTVVELTAKNLALETAAKETAATARVDALVKDGRVTPADRKELFDLAIAEPKAFDVIEKQLAKRPRVADYSERREGSSADGGMTAAADEVVALARTEQDADKALSSADAMVRVFKKNPALYERYKAETAVKV